MKAKVKSTGEVIEVMQVCEKEESFYVRLDILNTTEVRYHISELEFEGFETEGKFAETCLNGIKQDIVYSPNYWTKLEHQYAGMAMQTMLATLYNSKYCVGVFESYANVDSKEIARLSKVYAHALVEKMRNKEE